jgi:uncharacterized membrane-anchored protein
MQVRNLPVISARYWTAILVASMCGANTGDFLSHNLNLGHYRGLLPLAAIFTAILWAETRARAATEAYYWLAIIVLRTAATNLADLGTHDFRLSYGIIEPGLTLLLVLAVVLYPARWKNRQPANSVRVLKLPATDPPYWIAMLIAGTLGTATGDFVAGPLGLGLFFGSAVLIILFAAILFVSWRFGEMTVGWYWASIVAARTAGTTLGDMLASRHGLQLGLSLSTVITGSLLAGVVLLWPQRREPVMIR